MTSPPSRLLAHRSFEDRLGSAEGGTAWPPGLESVLPSTPEDVALEETLLGPHSADIVGFLSAARRTGGPLLDLACGSGRLTIPFSNFGFDIDAVDRSADALAALRLRVDEQTRPGRGAVRTIRSDLADLRLDRMYRMAMLAGASISAVPPSSRQRLFREIAVHLADRGVLMLDFCSHDPEALAAEPERTWAFRVPHFDGTRELVIAKQVFDLRDRSERITYYIERLEGDEVTRRVLNCRKWIVDTDDLVAAISRAGLEATSVERQELAPGSHSVLLTCTPRT
jgi:SAM-dependent methyltransferase